MFYSNYEDFIKVIYSRLIALGINTDELKIDHIGYQADSSADYDAKVLLMEEDAEQISENIVGERRVGMFKLKSSLHYKGNSFDVIEIFEPRKGQEVNSALEHIEFLVNGSLEDLMAQYPNVDWDSTVINRNEFPMLILKLGDGLRAKFPRRGVLEEINRI